MASFIKRGESILIPFRNGLSISDSQLKPRMYKTVQAFEKSFPGHYLGTNGVELVEYAEVVRCKDCKRWKRVYGDSGTCELHELNPAIYAINSDGFCSYGERKDNGKI